MQEQHNYETAKTYFQQALQANCENFDNDDIYSNPPLNDYYYSFVLFQTLRAKANFLLEYGENKTHNPYDMQIAIETCYLADEMIEQMRHSYFYENAQLSLGKEAFLLSENALAAIWLLQTTAQPTVTKL